MTDEHNDDGAEYINISCCSINETIKHLFKKKVHRQDERVIF